MMTALHRMRCHDEPLLVSFRSHSFNRVELVLSMLLRLLRGVWVVDGPVKCVRRKSWEVILQLDLRFQAALNVRDVIYIVVRSADCLVA